jgi:hypothetical protein
MRPASEFSDCEPRRPLTPRQKFEIRQFRDAGVSIGNCAGYFKVSAATVKRVLSEFRLLLGGPSKRPRHPGEDVSVSRLRCERMGVIPELAKWLRAKCLVPKKEARP